MSVVLDIVLPVFGVVGLGYGATRVGWFSGDAESGLAKYVFDFAVPLMLLRTLATAELPETVPWGFFGSYYLSAAFVFCLGFLIARYGFRRTSGGQAITGFGFSYSNAVLLGLPLIMTTYGEEAELPFFILLSMHGLSFFTLMTLLLELDRQASSGPRREMALQIGRSLVTNPILLGIFVGLCFNLGPVSLPQPIEEICALMQQSVTPCALFSLGASLTRYGIAGRLFQSSVVVVAKTVLMPALVFVLATYVFHIEPLWTQVAVLMAAQPSGVMTYVFAKKYGVGQAIATTSIFLSTTSSLVTLSIILYLFDVR